MDIIDILNIIDILDIIDITCIIKYHIHMLHDSIHILYISYCTISYHYNYTIPYLFCCPGPSLWPVGRSKRRDANLRPTASPGGPIFHFSYCRENMGKHKKHTEKSTNHWRYLEITCNCSNVCVKLLTPCLLWTKKAAQPMQMAWSNHTSPTKTRSANSYERQIPKNLEQFSKWIISHTVKKTIDMN